jgi:hypothetical protein
MAAAQVSMAASLLDIAAAQKVLVEIAHQGR